MPISHTDAFDMPGPAPAESFLDFFPEFISQETPEHQIFLCVSQKRTVAIETFIPAFVNESRFLHAFPGQNCIDDYEDELFRSHGISPDLISLAADFDISLADLMHYDEHVSTAGASSAETRIFSSTNRNI